MFRSHEWNCSTNPIDFDTFTRTFIPIYLNSHETISREEDRLSRVVDLERLILSFFFSFSLSYIDLHYPNLFYWEAGVPLYSLFLSQAQFPYSSLFHRGLGGLRAFLQREKVTFAFETRLHRSCDGLLALEQLRAGNEAQSCV